MAAAFFRMAYAVIISRGIRSLPMLKCSSERWVCAPHSLSAGTLTSPRLSVSLRTSATAHLSLDLRDTTEGGRAKKAFNPTSVHPRAPPPLPPLPLGGEVGW